MFNENGQPYLGMDRIYNITIYEDLVVNQEYIYQFRIDDATYEDIQRNLTAILGAITIDVWWNDDPIIPSFYTITTLTNPFEGGTTYGDGTFEGGTENTVLAVPNTNYDFIDWTVDGIQVSIDEEYTFILENNITLVANFQLISGPAPVLVGAIPGIEEISLEWEAIPENSKTTYFNFGKDGHWTVMGNPAGIIWSIFIRGATFDGINMVAGDEIAIFDGDLLVGAFTLTQVCAPENLFDNEMWTFSLLINGPGYTPGNPFTFKAWDQSAGIESTSFEYGFSDPYGDAYVGDVFPDGGPYSIAEITFTTEYIPTYNIYFEDGTLVTGGIQGNTYTNTDLTAGQEYCYYITQILEGGGESNPSNVLCATPLFDVAPVLVSAIPGIEEISLEWEAIPEIDKTSHYDLGNDGEHWDLVEGAPTANTWAIYIGGALFNVDGYDLEAGDEIAIFDGDLLVGAFTLTQVCTPDNQFENVLNAYDLLLNGPGFTPGNPFIFKVWDQSENLESTVFEYTFWGGYVGDVFPDEGCYTLATLSFSGGGSQDFFNIYYEDGTLVVGEVEGTTYTDMDLTVGQEYCYYVTQIMEGGEESDSSNVLCAIPIGNFGIQNFDLETGFQFVSSRLVPENPDMLLVIEEILNENLDFVRNSLGQTLRKIGPNWVNGIGDWVVDEGYLVKMYTGDYFTITGTLVDPSTPIPIATGFQFVSYFPENSMDALIAFETIIGDDLDFIRDSEGTMIRKIGPNWVNGIGDCQPGEGYLIKMFADDILIYSGSSSFTCGDPFTDPRNEQTYETIEIGDQCWMAENLNIGTMINGSEDMTNNRVIEKYCFDNDPANCETYGGLYQWDEIMDYVTDTAVQGICPEGWHLPTDHEWKILEGTVDSQYPVGDPIWNQTRYRGYDAGLNLKSISGWHLGGNGSGLYNYEALPGGFRVYYGNFGNLTYYGSFWSSSEYSYSWAWFRRISYNYVEVYRSYYDKENGNSVRCLQDYSIVDNLSIQERNNTYEFSNQKPKNFVAANFIFEGGNPADPVYTIYIKGLEIGNEVAAYDGDILVGAMKINSTKDFENELPVFSTLTNGQGYKVGNPITLKVWSDNNIIPSDFTMKSIYDSYVSDVYPEGDGKYSVVNITKGAIEKAEETIYIYPNPSDGIFNISIEGVSGKAQVKVFDIHGNDYRFFEIEGKNNIITEKLDLKELATGVYFISFTSRNLSQVKKIVVQ